MAIALEASMTPLDNRMDTPEPAETYEPSGPAAGRRALEHLAQSLLTLLRPTPDRAQQLLDRYLAATNMTRRMACLAGLVSLQGIADKPCRTALDNFLNRYRDNDLALDKWFTVQVATIRLHDTEGLDLIATVQELLNHPLYDLASPNRIRSLLGPFFMQVSPGFHRIDGAGYDLWREQLARLASRNSQLASRLARSLDRWQAFEPQRRLAMHRAIQSLAETPGLPADLAEVCGRFLSDVTESSR
jgi:aminopeptidase N